MAGSWLGIETSTSEGGLALVRDGRVLHMKSFPVMATHSEKLLPGISRMLEEAGMKKPSGIAVSAGPGSYTGLRIGFATALGLSRGWGIGIVSVETLRVIAHSLGSEGPVLACTNARKGEIFAAMYADSGPFSDVMMKPGVYEVSAVSSYLSQFSDFRLAGNGRYTLRESGITDSGLDRADTPDPAAVAILGEKLFDVRGFDEAPGPLYLRDFKQKARGNVT